MLRDKPLNKFFKSSLFKYQAVFFTPENKVLIQEKLTMTEFMNTMVEMLMNISL